MGSNFKKKIARIEKILRQRAPCDGTRGEQKDRRLSDEDFGREIAHLEAQSEQLRHRYFRALKRRPEDVDLADLQNQLESVEYDCEIAYLRWHEVIKWRIQQNRAQASQMLLWQDEKAALDEAHEALLIQERSLRGSLASRARKRITIFTQINQREEPQADTG